MDLQEKIVTKNVHVKIIKDVIEKLKNVNALNNFLVNLVNLLNASKDAIQKEFVI